jgi:hypothetical protein
MRTRLTLLLLGGLSWLPCIAPGWAAAPALQDYVGAYVGRAEDELSENGKLETRDIDISITLDKKGGLHLDWINVTLVDGRRDVPGVERREGELVLIPAAGKGKSFLVEASNSSPFKLKDEIEPLQGDAVRWAALDEAGLHLYSFVVLDDGRYEMQTYTRQLTPTGMSLLFERNVDGQTVRRIKGMAVRAE